MTGLKWVGNYAGGRPKGMCWEALEGGSWLIQNPDDRRLVKKYLHIFELLKILLLLIRINFVILS